MIPALGGAERRVRDTLWDEQRFFEVWFTGHLAWSPERETLTAFRDVCWYSWKEQTRSMEKLLAYRFASVLPGHGRIHHGTAEEMHEHLQRCVARMKKE